MYNVFFSFLDVKEKFRVRYADIDGKNSVVPEDGKPFVILSQCIYACHHGPDKNKTKKIAYKVQQLLAREVIYFYVYLILPLLNLLI